MDKGPQKLLMIKAILSKKGKSWKFHINRLQNAILGYNNLKSMVLKKNYLLSELIKLFPVIVPSYLSFFMIQGIKVYKIGIKTFIDHKS